MEQASNFIDSVTVEGFWGSRDISFQFHDDVNFIIGINGSGKTTVVNLIVAALTADFHALDRIRFNKIEIKLKSNDSTRKPSIKVVKTPVEDRPFSGIEYYVQEKSSSSPKKYDLTDFEEQFMLRRYPRRIIKREMYYLKFNGILSDLEKLVSVRWLSVDRAEEERVTGGGDDFTSSVDKKLKDQSDNLVRYFSALNKNGEDLLKEFQKEVFLSLLYKKPRKGGLFGPALSIDPDAEKKALENIFSQFDLYAQDFQSRLDQHFNLLNQSRKKMQEEDGNLGWEEISILAGVDRIDTIVDEWKSLLEKRSILYRARDTFNEEVLEGKHSEYADDIDFWRCVFNKCRFPKRVEFRAIGSKSAGNMLCDLITSGQIRNICLARDSDLDDFDNTKIASPYVLYTYGYSWENDLFCQDTLIEFARKINSASVDFNIISDDIGKYYRKFGQQAARINLIEISCRQNGKRFITSMNGERFLPKPGQEPLLKKEQVLKTFRELKGTIARPVSYGHLPVEVCSTRHTYGKLQEAFFRSLFAYINNKHLKIKGPISKAYLRRLILDVFKDHVGLDSDAYYSNQLTDLLAALR